MTSWRTGDPCWWCDRCDVPVVWIGEARNGSGAFSAPIYVCPWCLERLEARIQRHVDSRYRV